VFTNEAFERLVQKCSLFGGKCHGWLPL